MLDVAVSEADNMAALRKDAPFILIKVDTGA